MLGAAAPELLLSAIRAVDDGLRVNRQVGLPAGVAHVMSVEVFPIAFSSTLLTSEHAVSIAVPTAG